MSNLAYIDPPITEVLDGKVVAMSPAYVRHNNVAFNIASIFRRYLKGKACRVLPDGNKVYLSKRDIVVPDVMIVCNKDIIKDNGVHGAPDLVVEVLSISTSKRDRGYKKNLYEKHGVKEYWLVDIKNREVEVHLLKNGRFELDNVYSIYPDWMLEKMTDEERAEVPMEFTISLFDDIIISIEEVFEDIM